MRSVIKEKNMFIRQGDVLLRPVKSVRGKQVKHSGSFILAEGERTGHHHKLTGQFKVKEAVDRRFLIVEVASLLTHQEHDTLTVNPGTYEVVREREFDYELQGIRNVVD